VTFHCLKISTPLMRFVEAATTRVAPLRLLTQALMLGTVCENVDSPQAARERLVRNAGRMGIPSIDFLRANESNVAETASSCRERSLKELSNPCLPHFHPAEILHNPNWQLATGSWQLEVHVGPAEVSYSKMAIKADFSRKMVTKEH
jgi:hypothetical protein